jgi:hypothetical protein
MNLPLGFATSALELLPRNRTAEGAEGAEER